MKAITDLIKATKVWDKIVVNISGGKDSAVLLWWAVQNFPIEKIVAIHAVIDIDWDETMDVVKAQCEFFGVPLMTAKAVDKKGNEIGFLDILNRPRKNRKTGEMGENMFPEKAESRWCTSSLKTGPLQKLLTPMTGNILQLIGERKAESTKRAAKLTRSGYIHYNKAASAPSKGREVYNCHPIMDMSDKEVWDIINEVGMPKHPAYSWGVSRASCAICIYSSPEEIKIAAEKAPHIVKRYMEAEAKIKHTFNYKPATKKKAAQTETVKEILEKQGVTMDDINSRLKKSYKVAV